MAFLTMPVYHMQVIFWSALVTLTFGMYSGFVGLDGYYLHYILLSYSFSVVLRSRITRNHTRGDTDRYTDNASVL